MTPEERDHDPNAVSVYVATMTLGDGTCDYYVTIKRCGKIITPHKFREKWKANYEVAEYRHVLLDWPKPNILDYGPEKNNA